MSETEWVKTTKRFVVLLDILGFKDLVSRDSHSEVLKKLEILKEVLTDLAGNVGKFLKAGKGNIAPYKTKSVTFSDSIIIFSKGDTYDDALKILFDAYTTINKAINHGISIKGAISFGDITVDFEKSLFFGQPIIDAYLLHEELQMLTVILDNNTENQIKTYKDFEILDAIIEKFKAYLKSGRITHSILKPFGEKLINERIAALQRLYYSSCGRPRIYIDNTLDFLRQVKV